MSPEEGLQGGAACELGRFEGRPAAQKVTENEGIFVLEPLEHLGEIIFQRTGEAVGYPHFIPDHAPPMFDKLFEGAHGGALWIERLQLVPMREQQFELQFGVGGIVFGPTRGEGFTIPCQRERMIGKRIRKSYLRKAQTSGPLVSSRQRATG